MTEDAGAAARKLRRTILTWVFIGWFVLDVFDGLLVPEETPEHWLEAAWWAVAIPVYLLLARRRPLPSAPIGIG